MIFNFEKLKERRKERYEKYRKMWKDEIKSIVREAMDEWTADCSYLTQDQGDGRYYCSKEGCQGVKISTK